LLSILSASPSGKRSAVQGFPNIHRAANCFAMFSSASVILIPDHWRFVVAIWFWSQSRGLPSWRIQPSLLDSVRHRDAIGHILCICADTKANRNAADINRLLDHSRSRRLWRGYLAYVSVPPLLKPIPPHGAHTRIPHPHSIRREWIREELAARSSTCYCCWGVRYPGSRSLVSLFAVGRHSSVPEDLDAVPRSQLHQECPMQLPWARQQADTSTCTTVKLSMAVCDAFITTDSM